MLKQTRGTMYTISHAHDRRTCRCPNELLSCCCAVRVLAASSSPPVGSSSRCTCRGRRSAPTCCDACSVCASRVNTEGAATAPLPASLSAAVLPLRLLLALRPPSEPLPLPRPGGTSHGTPWGLITHAICSSSYSTCSCTPAAAMRAASAATARASRSPDGSCTAAPTRSTHCSSSPPASVLWWVGGKGTGVCVPRLFVRSASGAHVACPTACARRVCGGNRSTHCEGLAASWPSMWMVRRLTCSVLGW